MPPLLAAATTTTPGLSAVPGTVVIGGARQATMTGVNVATAGRISGTFSGSQGLGALAATTPTQTVPSASMGWVLQAPPSIPGQRTARDRGWRRYDKPGACGPSTRRPTTASTPAWWVRTP